MVKITLVTVGKIKEKYLTDGIDEYSKRLSAFCDLKIISLQDEKTPDGASEALEKQIKDKEGERILKVIPEGAYVFTLEINGEQFTSPGFSKKLQTLTNQGNSHFVFIIGGSLGLSDNVIARKNADISFSKMTFPHQLMRLIFLEQLYRAFKIWHGEPYHK